MRPVLGSQLSQSGPFGQIAPMGWRQSASKLQQVGLPANLILGHVPPNPFSQWQICNQQSGLRDGTRVASCYMKLVASRAWLVFIGPLSLLASVGISGCATQDLETQSAREQRPFFQEEREVETHGRKSWLDRMVEADPGKLKVEMASDYQDHPPAVIAVMPFGDHGSANFTVDKIPITFRNQEEKDKWSWTDAQRLRRSMVGYLAQREFVVVNPIAVDAVLKEHGIDNMEKLRRASPIELGRLLGADALVYGTVDSYEGYYFGIMSAYEVGVSTWMISSRDGETLMTENGSRYSVDLQPALSPQDAMINSVMTLLEFRDVTLARAESEVSRELVLRIPVSETLKTQLATRAVQHADEIESEEAMADTPMSSQGSNELLEAISPAVTPVQ